MFDEVSDNRLLTMWQKHLKTTTHIYKKNLTGFKLCGSQATRNPGAIPSAVIMSNGEKTRIVGIQTCHSAWACPRCTPRVMAQYGTRIACAIEALEKKYNQYAVMITFTLPHTDHMTCWEAFKILQDTWRQFARRGSTKVTRKHTCKDGTEKTYKISTNAYNAMRSELGIKHFVRVYEATYGEDNGWHPHIHALYWIPKQNFNKVVDYEESLIEAWWSAAKNCALKFYGNQEYVDKLYADYKKHPVTGHKSVFISRNKDGKPRKQESSHYVVGWTGDFELTNIKSKNAHYEGHYSPNQILQMAYDNPSQKEYWLNLYDQYAEATRGKKRVNFSPTGINEIVTEWKMSNEYILMLKKKCTDKAQDKWKLVVWFTEKQWSSITSINLEETGYLIAELLALAKLSNGKQLITELLIKYGIDISSNGRHPRQDEIENQTFENRILTA